MKNKNLEVVFQGIIEGLYMNKINACPFTDKCHQFKFNIIENHAAPKGERLVDWWHDNYVTQPKL